MASKKNKNPFCMGNVRKGFLPWGASRVNGREGKLYKKKAAAEGNGSN